MNNGKMVTMIKVRESDDPTHPNHIEIGREFSGLCYSNPVVGECFHVGYTRTSTVKEILSPDTFRTHNSIYKWEAS